MIIGAMESGKVREVVEEVRVKEAVLNWEDSGGGNKVVSELVRAGIGRETVISVIRTAVWEEGLFDRSVLSIVEDL